MPPQRRELALHPVSLDRVWVHAVRTLRRSSDEDEEARPTVRIPSVRVVSQSEGRDFFECALKTRLSMPAHGGIWVGDVELRASFSSEGLTRAQLTHFRRNSALFVMWPHARVWLDDLARMSDISGPPLPLIVRAPETAELNG